MHFLTIKTISCVLAIFFICNFSKGQKIDSLSIEESIAVMKDEKEKIGFLLNLAQSNLRDSIVSLYCVNTALNISKEIRYDSGIINSLHLKARIFSANGKYDDSYDAFDEIFNIYEYDVPTSQLSHLHAELGDLSFTTKHYKEAWEHFQFAADGYREVNDKYNLAKTIEKIGLIYIEGKDFTKAEESFNNAISLFMELLNHHQIGIQQIHLGDLYILNNKYPEAESAFDKALLRANIIRNDTMKAQVKYKFGSLYFLWDKKQNAHLNFKEAAELYDQTNNVLWVGHSYSENARVYVSENNYSKAIEYFDEALACFNKCKRYDLVANIYLEKGRFQLNNKVYTNANKNLEIALQYSYELELGEIELGSYFELQRYYKELNNHEQSFYYLKKYVALKDTLFSRVKEESIEQSTYQSPYTTTF